MNAVLVERPGKAALTTLPDPDAAPGEALVRVRGCGMCGTDQHLLSEGLPTIRYPLVPGHEAWGEVVGAASAPGVQPGQLVAIDPSLHCGTCSRCRAGQGNLCENWGAIGGTRYGAWAELVAVPARNLYPLPDGYPLDLAVLIEPVACLLRGLHLLAPEADRSALVFGAGTMGTLWSLALRLAGTRLLAVVESDPVRRGLCIARCDLPVIAPEELGTLEADYVIDATGVAAAMMQATWHASPGGSVMFFGVAGEDVRVPISPFRLYQRELRILSSMAILHTYGAAVGYVERHAELLRPVVTDVFPLADFESALSRLSDGGALKVALDPSR